VLTRRLHRLALPLLPAALAAGCLQPSPGARLERIGDEIVACGQLFHTTAPVVLWMDHRGYDAYRVECRFNPERTRPSDGGESADPNRYGSFRKHLPPEVAAAVRSDGWSLDQLRQYVDLFVLHYDVCGTARRCFKVLHDQRGLSVHFMLDVDGTIYQTLDLKERAWHAGIGNDRSVGIEIANMGAYEDRSTLEQWYEPDAGGLMVFRPPLTDGASGIRTPGFVARPARPAPIGGPIHGRMLWQYDLTDAQYESLIRLTATLCRVLPRIACDAPRDGAGQIRTDVLTPEELSSFSGLIGHYHLTRDKSDPGPAFDWERVIRGARRWRG